MMSLAFDVIARLQGKSLATAESCTGGGIGDALTAVPGASNVYKGGIISYCNEIKHKLLGVPEEMLAQYGAVSDPVAQAMAKGARGALNADVAVSVTGLAGPSGDEYGNPVGTVYIGYADANTCLSRHFLFSGDRESVRGQAIEAALALICELV
ncbi:MAG: CinA family protein [Ruminococcaceae bacterium]|nr:CinA family protein [Oscillospiraceae bacterium]